jgi:cell wall-associated NlpC family hydrolase
MTTHDDLAIGLIGKPYRRLARGPDAFDCWGLYDYVLRMQFGVIGLPNISFDHTESKALRTRFIRAVDAGEAEKTDKPFDGCATYMSRGRLPDHIGVYLSLDGGGTLHVLEKTGVIFTKIGALRPLGLNILGFYRPRGLPWPSSTS